MSSQTGRQKDALDMDNSVCVTASAGTGKTFVLIKRYRACLLDETTDPRNILCLTFTDKAAAEMREKIEQDVKNDGGNNRKLLDALHRCTISTFHGFCSALLHEFPIEAGVDPGFDIMDNIDREELVKITINNVLKRAPKSIRSDVIQLYRHQNSNEIKDGIQHILSKWRDCANWFRKLADDSRSIYDAWSRRYENELTASVELITKDEKIRELMRLYELSDINKESKKTQRCYQIFQELCKERTPAEICELLTKFSKDKYEFTQVNNGKEYPLELLKHYRRVKKRVKVPGILYPYEDEHTAFLFSILNSYGHVTEYISKVINEKKRMNNLLNFDDLIEHAKMLMDNEKVVETLRKRYHYILVDEVQDNDPALTYIVQRLAEDFVKNKNLFIVGDVKQSIYGFRGADPNQVTEFMARFEKTVELDKNFRTVKPVNDVINRVFKGIYPEGKTAPNAIVYQEIEAHRKNDEGSFTILESRYDSKKPYEEEATLLASWIKTNVGNLMVYKEGKKIPAKYADFAILLDKRNNIDILKKKLDEFSIPYQERKGRNFYKKQEIIDILNVIKTVAAEEDDISLYGTLRSPYFGITDGDLAVAASTNKNDPVGLWTRLKNSTNPKIAKALAIIHELRDFAPRHSVSELVSEIIRKTGILSIYAAIPQGMAKIGNLLKFSDLASAKTQSQGISLYNFIRMIDTCINESIEEEESAGFESDTENAVKILTIHASKGLEYPITIIMFAGRGSKLVKTKGMLSSETYGVCPAGLKYIDNKNVAAFPTYLINKEQQEKESAERRRLFYVAMTRARDHLVISESVKDEPEDESFLSYYRSVISESNDEPIRKMCPKPEKPITITFPEQDPWDCTPQAVHPVSEKAEKQDGILPNAGMIRGDCIHDIFCGMNAGVTCRRYGMPEKTEEFQKKYERFLASPLMQDVTESFCELNIMTKDGESRRIDRLVKKTDGSYLIIDYKSDHTKERLKEWKKQLTEYSETMSEILHTHVPAVIYITATGETVPIVE
ncbi:MAG TPA: UvrD-helicase domain-containing protein [Methanocorpusculum sp.]|nr:UvrD-helicase domain-containing protein [Methanocorpusculum sp.]